MPRFVYATAILPGKTELVRHAYQQKQLNTEGQKEEEYWNLIGLEGWQAWIHHAPRADYFIHAPETKNLESLFHALQDQIEAGNALAEWLRDFYLDVTGKDYSHTSATPDLELMFTSEITTPAPQQGTVVSRGFVYPLIPAKVTAHREFWRQCQGEYRYRIQDANREQGIIKDTRYLQKTPHQDFLVTYQELISSDQERDEKRSEAQASPASKWMSDVLKEHTGLTVKQLEPAVESLTRQPRATIDQWRPLAYSS